MTRVPSWPQCISFSRGAALYKPQSSQTPCMDWGTEVRDTGENLQAGIFTQLLIPPTTAGGGDSVTRPSASWLLATRCRLSSHKLKSHLQLLPL